MLQRTASVISIGLLLAFAGFAWDLEDEADDFDFESARFKRQTTTDGKKCNHELLKSLRKSCCKLPSFFGNGTWRGCKQSVHGSEKDDKVTPEQRFCVAQCVYQSKSLLTSDGKVDTGKMTTALLANKNATWTSLLQTVISSCINSVGSLTPIATKTGDKTCNPTPTALMWCIRRQAILSCPSTSKLSGSNCAADLQTLTSCVQLPAITKLSNTTSG